MKINLRDKSCIFTNDVETTSIWLNTLRDNTGLKVLREGMPMLLDIYSEFSIKSTFFVTGYIAKLFPEIVKMIINNGHEVASHGKSHLPEDGFDIMSFQKQKIHLEFTKNLLEDISGEEVISFRAPALRVNGDTARALLETGHKIDSSVASQRFDFFLSFGSTNKLKWLFAPRLPYKVDPNNIFRKGDSELIEIPVSAMFFPYSSTTMRVFPWMTSIQRIAINWENNFNRKPIVFDIHPNEFIDESDEKRVITNRSNSLLNYFLKDLIRSKMKIKNLGYNAVNLYKKEIKFYIERGYKFTTVRSYCENNSLFD